MDLKKDDWKAILFSVISIGVLIYIGILVLSNVGLEINHDLPMIGEFCLDKQDEQNIEYLNLEVVKDKSWNCSNCDNGTCYVDMLEAMSSGI